MADEIDAVVPEATEVEEVVAPEVETEEAETQEEDVDWKAKATKAEELANNYKVRAEKAERKSREAPAPAATASSPMSLADAAALLKADVHEDDIERVEKYAKAEGVTVREALKSDELKAILSVRAEKRTTANAANISNVRRGPSQMSDASLIEQANKGKLPDSDADIERLIAARAKRK